MNTGFGFASTHSLTIFICVHPCARSSAPVANKCIKLFTLFRSPRLISPQPYAQLGDPDLDLLVRGHPLTVPLELLEGAHRVTQVQIAEDPEISAGGQILRKAVDRLLVEDRKSTRLNSSHQLI